MSVGVLVAVEGDTDEPFAARLVKAAGLSVDRTIVLYGHGDLDSRVARWCHPSNHRPMLVLRDFNPNFGTPCPPALLTHLIGAGPHSVTTVVRIAERELEAWLLADREGVATYFHVPVQAIPTSPDGETDPKRTLVNLCRRSSSSRIRRGMVPDPRGGRQVGPEFTGLLLGFGGGTWSVERARQASPSLDRAVGAIERMGRHLAE
jgi:hypothetical protein